jgi:hypothetical protein
MFVITFVPFGGVKTPNVSQWSILKKKFILL